ncbi:hypothetical protein EDM58_24670 [Brevibacillus panacihumi]|uniref:Uncharacterized protein n=1 Tax=Brevibacillus panacihumi TaxID=497735 RepID=A0A3M8BYR7_9BACL|nr:hypothetical protein EDM58_24670 [Brevibacillus panacihumi]
MGIIFFKDRRTFWERQEVKGIAGLKAVHLPYLPKRSGQTRRGSDIQTVSMNIIYRKLKTYTLVRAEEPNVQREICEGEGSQ